MRSFGDELKKSESKKDFFTESIKRRENNEVLIKIEKSLNEGEKVQHFISNLYGNNKKTIVFTTSRLIYLEHGYGKEEKKEVVLSQIKYIESDFDLGYGKIRICSDDLFLEIDEITESTLRSILFMVKESKDFEEEKSKNKRTAFNLGEEIEKLNILKEKRIISNEEFKKAKMALIH
ncbi:PH domain-containing protein [Clostridium sp. B9]|uniref:PH domain-containing protein n=1 Tax=Clostridium sp. B9 TaxID=3423224 RepID=UPI003D2EE0A5